MIRTRDFPLVMELYPNLHFRDIYLCDEMWSTLLLRPTSSRTLRSSSSDIQGNISILNFVSLSFYILISPVLFQIWIRLLWKSRSSKISFSCALKIMSCSVVVVGFVCFVFLGNEIPNEENSDIWVLLLLLFIFKQIGTSHQ